MASEANAPVGPVRDAEPDGADLLAGPRKHWVVFLLSLTLVGMELIWTRLFSAEFFYAFAFLTLSLAIMGLGLGALALRLLPALNKDSGVSGCLPLPDGSGDAGRTAPGLPGSG